MKKNRGVQRKNSEKHVSKKRFVKAVAPAFKLKVKKGDTVKVLSGKDKGKTGEVLRAMPRENKVVVDGIALSKRHLRSTGRGQSGRIVERPMPIHVSNVALATPRAKK
jgi:large subunit ribosomal protein L24